MWTFIFQSDFFILIKSNSCDWWVEEDAVSEVCVGPLREWCSLFEIDSLRVVGQVWQRLGREEFSVGCLPGAVLALSYQRIPLSSICGHTWAISFPYLRQKLISEHIQSAIWSRSSVIITCIPVPLPTYIPRFTHSQHLGIILLYFKAYFTSISIMLNACFFHFQHFLSNF